MARPESTARMAEARPMKRKRDEASELPITAAERLVTTGARKVPRLAVARQRAMSSVVCCLSDVPTLPMHCGSTKVLPVPTRKLPI